MRLLLAILLLGLTGEAGRTEGQVCLFKSAPVAECNGQSHSFTFQLPVPPNHRAEITSAYFQLHTGTTPIQLIGGLINVSVPGPHGAISIVGGMNRHGAARWAHDPPIIMLKDAREIVVTYGCDMPKATPPTRTWWDRIKARMIHNWNMIPPELPPSGSIMPDIQVCWKE